MEQRNPFTIVTDANFQKEVLENPIPVLVEFEAEWSGTCHILAPVIEALAFAFEGRIKMCKLDVDVNVQVVQKYGAQKIPTFLFFKHGQIVDHLIGAVSKEDLIAKLTSLL